MGLTFGASAIAAVAIGSAGTALSDAMGQGISKGFANINLKSIGKSAGSGILAAGAGKLVSQVAGKAGSAVAAKAANFLDDAGQKVVERATTSFFTNASMGAAQDASSQLFDIADGTQQGGYNFKQTLGFAVASGASGAVADVAFEKMAVAVGKIKQTKRQSLEKGLFRKDGNTGAFSKLQEPMQLRHVKKIVKRAGIELDGVKIRIVRDKGLINQP